MEEIEKNKVEIKKSKTLDDIYDAILATNRLLVKILEGPIKTISSRTVLSKVKRD